MTQAHIDRAPAHLLVGREQETAALIAGLDDAIAGRGRLFLISGEPGIGKTWLADEVARHAVERGMWVAWGRCWEGGGAPAYWPWVQGLRSILVYPDRTRARPPLVSPEIGQLIPELSSETNRPTSSDPDQARFRLFDGIATMLKDVARSQPLVLIFDDLHEADQDSLEMLKFVARGLRDSQIVVIGNYRDAGVRRSQTLSNAIAELLRDGDQILLAGLAETEVARMVEARAALAPSASFVADLHRATAGNPLFVDGVVRVLIAEGKLAGAERLDLSGFKLPEGSRGAIRKRLAILSTDAQVLLVVAAVIGQEFESGLLERVSNLAAEGLLDLLAEAAAAGITVSLDGSRYRFTHPLIREALYSESTAAERIALHRQIGDALEEIYASDLSPHLAQLAHHYRQSRDIDKAIDYSIRAGDAANAVFAYEDAILHWTAAEQLTERLPAPNERRARLLERLGDELVLTGADQWTALKHLESALHAYESLNRPERAARVHSRLGIALSYGGRPTCDLRGALSHYRAAESILGGGPETTSLGLLHIGLAVTAGGLARYEEGLAASSRAMEIARRLGNDSMWVHGAVQRSYCLFFRGHLRESFELCRRAWEEADRLKDSRACSTAARIGAGCCNLLWDPVEAKRWAKLELDRPRLNLAIAERDSLLWQVAIAQTNVGDMKGAREVATRLSDQPMQVGRYLEAFERGLTFFEGKWEIFEHFQIESMEVARRSGGRNEELGCLNLLGRVRRYAGKLKQAEDSLREFLALSPADPTEEMHARPEIAIVYCGLGRPEEALPHLQRCREIMAAGEDWRGMAGLVDLAESVVACADGGHTDAERGFRRSLEVFIHYDLPYLQADTLYYWGQALASAGERDQSEAKFESAMDIYRRVGAGQPWIDRVEAARQPAQNDKGSVAGQFRKEGHYWTVTFGGETFRLKDSKSLRVIAHLIRNPSHQFHARELAALDSPNQPVAPPVPHFDENVGVTVSTDLGDAGVVLDARAMDEYRHRLEDLRPEIEEAERSNDLGRVSLLREEAEVLTAELAAGVGFQGRERRTSSHSERARLSVTKNIRGAIEKIREANPALGRHLANSIKTGYLCSYSPDPANSIVWRS
jgi:tetratricopeptide (TPR) repeat protein